MRTLRFLFPYPLSIGFFRLVFRLPGLATGTRAVLVFFFVIVELKFVAFCVPINPPSYMKFDALQLRSLLDILLIISGSLFT